MRGRVLQPRKGRNGRKGSAHVRLAVAIDCHKKHEEAHGLDGLSFCDLRALCGCLSCLWLFVRWKKTQAMGTVHSRRRVRDIELFVNVRDMRIDGAVANLEPTGDLLLYETFSK